MCASAKLYKVKGGGGPRAEKFGKRVYCHGGKPPTWFYDTTLQATPVFKCYHRTFEVAAILF